MGGRVLHRSDAWQAGYEDGHNGREPRAWELYTAVRLRALRSEYRAGYTVGWREQMGMVK